METNITTLTIPQMLQYIKATHADTPAQYIKDQTGSFTARSFGRLYQEVMAMAAGLHELGIKRGDHVGLLSENRAEWLVSDLAILSLGAADVPRGNDTMPQELQYILSFSECRTVIVENSWQLEKTAGILTELPLVETIIVLDEEYGESEIGPAEQKALRRVEVKRYAELIERGRGILGKVGTAVIEEEIAKGTPQDVATIIFTSGTTGQPKGVVLSHLNFLHQVACIPNFVTIRPGDVWLAVLPVWHSFERIMQYISIGSASAQAYSKPVGKIMLQDFGQVKPQWMASVPRIWESVRSGVIKKARAEGGIKWALFRFFVAVGGTHKRFDDLVRGRKPDFHARSRLIDFAGGLIPWLALWPLRALGNLLVFSKIKARLGGRFKAGVSGGGALPSSVDQFFGAAGILLLEGYGLTETAPVLAVRKQWRPVPGTVGNLIDGTECQIRAEDGSVLPPGAQGVVFVRGPQVMKGYYNRPDLTSQVLSADGWLNTGDLGMLTHGNELKITGRAKDTIVLRGGENVEPLPIEHKLKESELIDQAIVLGQDQKFLGALIVPNAEALLEALEAEGATGGGAPAAAGSPGAERESAGGGAGVATAPTQTAAEAGPGADPTLEQLVNDPRVRRLIEREINELVSARTGFRGFELIIRFRLVADQFQTGKELSAKQEVKRHVINEQYSQLISEMFA